MVDDRDPVAVLGLVHVVGGHEDRDARPLRQLSEVAPDVAPRLWIETDGRLVQEQDVRGVQHAARDLQAASHAT